MNTCMKFLLVFFIQQKKSNPQQRLCSIRDNDKKKKKKREDKATAKNCSIKRECLNIGEKEKFLTRTPHTANMLFS
jgi:hypothetical protein